MAKIRNASTVPQGMLAPNGYVDTPVDPFVQATTRPPGTLLAPSPGFDSIRQGKNRFQGRGPTGGFRRMTFAEDLGGSGAALSVVPGETSAIDATEWVEGTPGLTPEGTVLIADRSLDPGYASYLHEGMNSLPDMGDRHPDRPLTKSAASWVWHPAMMFKDEYRQNPVVAVLAAVGGVMVVTLIANDIEKEYKSRRGRGITGAAETPAAASRDVSDTGVDSVADATKKAVGEIEKVTNGAIDAISGAAKDATNEIKNAAKE